MTKYIYKFVSFISIYSILIISQNFTSLTYADGITYDDKIAYESEKQVTSEVNPYSLFSQKLIEKINKDADNLGIKWVKGGMQSFSEYNFSGFIVLNETLKKLSFIQGNFTYDSNNGKTLNIGLGHRTLVDVSPEFKDFVGGKEAMLEINTFYDLKSSQDGLLSSSNLFSSSHSRHSFGLRLSTPKYDFYGNLYQRGQNTFINDERVLSGHDFGFSGRIPKDDNLKFNLKRYNFSSDFNRKSGVKLRAEYFLTPHLSFGGEYDNSDQNNSSEELFINFTYNFGEKLNQRVNTTPSATKVWDKRYDEVIRENKVYLEKRLVITTITAPTLSGTLGSTVDVSLNAGNSGYDSSTMGAVKYAIKNRGNVTGASISVRDPKLLDLRGATITPANASATIEIQATIAANDQYAETTINYNVTVNRATAIIGIFVVSNPLTVTASNGSYPNSIAPTITPPNGYIGGAEYGNYVFTVLSNNTGATLNTSTGVASSATSPGTIDVQVKTAGGTKYDSFAVGTYSIVFATESINITTTPTLSGTLGSTVDVSLNAGNSEYDPSTMGEITYAIKNRGNVTGASISVRDSKLLDLSGATIIPASASATIEIEATIQANGYYTGTTTTYNVTVNRANNSYRYLGSNLNGASNLTITDGGRYTLPTASNLRLSNANGSSEVAYNANEMGTLSFEVQNTGGITGINTGSFTGTELAVNPPSTGAGNSGTVIIKVILSGGSKYSGTEFTYNVIYQ